MSAKFNFFVEAPPNSMLKVRTKPTEIRISWNIGVNRNKHLNYTFRELDIPHRLSKSP